MKGALFLRQGPVKHEPILLHTAEKLVHTQCPHKNRSRVPHCCTAPVSSDFCSILTSNRGVEKVKYREYHNKLLPLQRSLQVASPLAWEVIL